MPTKQNGTRSEKKIEYPTPLGSVQFIQREHGPEGQPRYIALASTLHHAEVLDDDEKRAVVSKAIREAIISGQRTKVKQIASAVMAGGWRLPFLDA